MVLESLAASILSSYLGDYVEGLQKENLKISIGSGDATLENLKLKKEALDQLELPVTVKAGFLERVFLVAGPKLPGDYDEKAEHKRQLNTKQKRLLLAEMLADNNKKEEDPKEKEAEEKKDNFTDRLVARVVNNLQVFINKMHIRYEDDTTDPNHPFVFGITLEHLHGQSTDENWNPCFLTETPKLIRKLVSLKNFAMYWDSDARFLQFKDNIEMEKQLDELIYQEGKPAPRHHYILNPICGALQVILNKSDIPDMAIPKLTLQFLFDKIALALEEAQFRDISQMVDSFSLYSKSIPYRKFRPASGRPTDDPRAWWRFAISAVCSDISERRRKWSWKYIQQTKKDRIEYIQLYKEKREKSEKKQKQSDSAVARLEELEARLPLDTILLFRQLADALLEKDKAFQEEQRKRLEREKAEKKEKQEKKSGWFGGWFSEKKETKPELKSLDLTEDMWKELYAALDDTGGNEAASATAVPKEYVKTRVIFQLGTGSIELKSSLNYANIARVAFFGFGITLHQRETSTSFECNLQSIQLEDFHTRNTKFPLLITPASAPTIASPVVASNAVTAAADPFLKVNVDIKPLYNSEDVHIKVAMQPLNVVLNKPVVDRIVAFFTGASRDTALGELSAVAAKQLEQLKQMTQLQLLYTIEGKKLIGVEFDIASPNVIVPEDFLSDTCPVLLVNLGRVGFRSLGNRSFKELTASAATSNIEEDFYDKFSLTLTTFQAAVLPNAATAYARLAATNASGEPTDQLIDKVDVNVDLKICMVKSDRLPKVKISGAMPSVRARLGVDTADKLFRVLKGLVDDLAAPSVNPAPLPAVAGSPNVARVLAAPARALAANANKLQQVGLGSLLTMVNSPSVGGKTGLAALAAASPTASARRSPASGTAVKTSTMSTAESDQKLRMLLAEQKLLELRFTVGDIALAVSGEGGSPLTELRLRNFAGSIVKRTYDLALDFALHSLAIEDKLNASAEQDSDLRYLATSEPAGSSANAEDLITFRYVSTARQSPAWTQHKVDTAIQVTFNQLFINFNRETVVALSRFLYAYVVPPWTKPSKYAVVATSTQPAVRPQPTAPSAPTAVAMETAPATTDSTEVTTLKFTAEIRAVRLSLNKETHRLALVSITNTAGELTLHPTDTIFLSGKLGNIGVRDMTVPLADELLSPVVMVTESAGVRNERVSVDFDIRIYDPQWKTRTNIKSDGDIRFRLHSTRFVLSQRFIRDLVCYATEISEVQRIVAGTASAASAAAAKAAEQLSLVDINKKFFHFDFVVDNPTVVLVATSERGDPNRMATFSAGVLVADLGQMHLSNRYYERPLPPVENVDTASTTARVQLIHQISIRIKAMNLKTARATALEGKLVPFGPPVVATASAPAADLLGKFVRDIECDISVDLPYSHAEYHAVPDLKLGVAIPRIALVLSEQQLYFVLGIFEENLERLYATDGILALLSTPAVAEPARQAVTAVATVTKEIVAPSHDVSTSKATALFVRNLIVFYLSTLSVEVFRGDGHIVVDGVDTPNGMAAFELEGFGTEVVQSSDDSMSVGVFVAKATLADTRPQAVSSNVFRQILAPHKDVSRTTATESVPFLENTAVVLERLKEASQLHVDYRKLAVGSVGNVRDHGYGKVTVMMVRPVIVAIPDVLFSLKDFVLPFVDRLMAVLDKMRPTDMAGTEPIAKSEKPKEDELEVKLHINNPDISVVDNPTDATAARSFVLRTTVDLTYTAAANHQRLTALFQSFEMFKCVAMAQEESALSIVEPCDVHLNFQSYASGGSNTTAAVGESNQPLPRVDIDVQIVRPMHVVISYNDYKLFMKLLMDVWMPYLTGEYAKKGTDAVTAAAAASVGMPAEEYRAPTLEEHLRKAATVVPALTMAVVNVDEDDNAAAARAKMAAEDLQRLQKARALRSSERARVQTQGVQVHLIDDVSGQNTPLLTARFDRLALDVIGWSSTRLGLVVDASTRWDYYNARLQCWEPFVESWQPAVNINREAAGVLTVTVCAPKRLDVNVTRAFLETLVATVENVSAAESTPSGGGGAAAATVSGPHGSVNVVSALGPPYVVVNDTGQDVVVWWANAPTEGTRVTVHTGQSKPLPPLTAVTESGRRGTAKLRRAERALDIGCQIGPFREIANVPISKTGEFALRVDTSGPNRNLWVIMEIANRRGSRVITLRSHIAVRNNTTLPLDVQLDIDGTSSILSAVPPDGAVSVPIVAAALGRLRFRPTGFDFEWSTGPLSGPELAALDKKRMTKLVACRPVSTELPFMYQVRIEKGCKGHAELAIQISLNPPLHIQNLLASEVDYELVDGEISLQKGTLVRGERTAVHCFRESNPAVALSLKLPRFKPSGRVLVHGIDGANQPDRTTKIGIKPLLPANDRSESKLTLTLANEKRFGVRTVRVFAEYWLVNRLGLRVLLRHNAVERNVLAAGQGGEAACQPNKEIWNLEVADPRDWYYDDYARQPVPPLMFSPEGTLNKFSLKVANSQWSSSLSLSGQSASVGTLSIDDRKVAGRVTRSFEVGLWVSPGSGPFWRTKTVVIGPRYVLHNAIGRPLLYHQVGTNQVFTLLPGEVLPFHWPDAAAPKLLRIRLPEPEWCWSGGFPISEIGGFDVKLGVAVAGARSYRPHVDIAVDNATAFITFRPERREFPTYRIDNHTSETVRICQKGVEGAHVEVVPPGMSTAFTWDEPSVRPLRVTVAFDGTRVSKDFALDKFEKHPPIHISASQKGKGRVITAETYGDGPSKVLRLRDRRQFAEQLERENAVVGGEFVVVKDGVDNEDVDTAPDSFKLELVLEGIGVSLVDDTPAELLYASFDKLNVTLASSPRVLGLEVAVSGIQLDNQLHTAQFPILLCPTALETNKDFFRLSFKMLKSYTSLDYIEYFSVLIQEMDIKVDSEFIDRIIQFVDVVTSSPLLNKPTANALSATADVAAFDALAAALVPSAAASNSNRMIYFDTLHLNPVKANVTFQAVAGVDTESAVAKWLSFGGGLLTNVERTPLRLSGLLLRHPFTTRRDLIHRITHHYSGQAISEVYKLLGSADFLGNPISLVSSLGTGVADFFYEPAEGIIHSPKDFGKGVVKGTKSLVKNSVYGIFNTTSKITGSIGRGIAQLSLDRDYLKEREAAARERPRHVGEGVLHGARDLGMGLFKGITGIVTEPIKGAKREGAGGFFKGVGRGVVGVATKSVTGVFDMVAKTTEGIKNTTTYFDDKKRHRVRPPRTFAADGRQLEPYDRARAEGQELLYRLDSGKYIATDKFILCITKLDPSAKTAAIITSQRLILVKKKSEEWSEPIARLKALEVKKADGLIVVHLSDGKRRPISVTNKSLDIEEVYNRLCDALKPLKFELSKPK